MPLLQAAGTAFVVVAAPERDALREASYFVERLDAEGMPLAGLVLNRVHPPVGAPACRAARAAAAAEELGDDDGGVLTDARGLRTLPRLRDYTRCGRRDRQRRWRDRFIAGHPRNTPVAEVPAPPRTSTTSTGCGGRRGAAGR